MSKVVKVKITESRLSVVFLKEGDTIVAYAPALDLSTCGQTVEEAKKNFEQAVDIFFRESSERGTLEEVLFSLGWHKSATRPKTWQPPEIVGHLDVTIPQYA